MHLASPARHSLQHGLDVVLFGNDPGTLSRSPDDEGLDALRQGAQKLKLEAGLPGHLGVREVPCPSQRLLRLGEEPCCAGQRLLGPRVVPFQERKDLQTNRVSPQPRVQVGRVIAEQDPLFLAKRAGLPS
jgi:hypothetical protein